MSFCHRHLLRETWCRLGGRDREKVDPVPELKRRELSDFAYLLHAVSAFDLIIIMSSPVNATFWLMECAVGLAMLREPV